MHLRETSTLCSKALQVHSTQPARRALLVPNGCPSCIRWRMDDERRNDRIRTC